MSGRNRVMTLPGRGYINEPLNDVDIRALRYIRNTNGAAKRRQFINDHSPIGVQLWQKLAAHGLVMENYVKAIVLTPMGLEKFKEANKEDK